MELGKRIKKLRKETTLSQEAFAQQLKVHSKQLAKYELGISTPSIKVVARIAKACEVPTDYLIFGEDKALAQKTKIADMELLDCFRRVNKLKKPDRDKIKWAIQGLLSNDRE